MLVRAEDADVIFQSVDGVQYHIHRKNLQCCAAAFPPDEFESDKHEIMHLPEISRCLDLLFAFMYPEPTPDVRSMPIDVVIDLAEAAEKYQAFAVMTICKLKMTYVLLPVSLAIFNFHSAMFNDHAIEVLQYAASHYDRDLLDVVAPVAMTKPLDTVILGLSPHVAITWVSAQSVAFYLPDPYYDFRSNTIRNGATH